MSPGLLSHYSWNKSCMKMKMSTEQWWNDTDKSKLKYLEKILSKCQFLHNKSQLYCLGSNPDFVRTPQITPRGSIGRTNMFIFVRGSNVCTLWESYETNSKYSFQKAGVLAFNLVVHILTTVLDFKELRAVTYSPNHHVYRGPVILYYFCVRSVYLCVSLLHMGYHEAKHVFTSTHTQGYLRRFSKDV